MAALQGVDLDKNESKTVDDDVPTVEQIQARARARLLGDRDAEAAANQGFTPEMGVVYKIAEGTEIG